MTIIQWFRDKRMKTQIGIYQSVMFVIVITLVILLYTVSVQFLINEFTDAQNELFQINNRSTLDKLVVKEMRLTQTLINTYANQIKSLIQIVQQVNEQQQQQTQNLLYDYTGVEQCPMSLMTPGHFHYHSYSFICGSNIKQINQTNPKHQQQISNANQIGQMASMFTPGLLGVTSHIIGIMSQDPQIFYTYPCYTVGTHLNELEISTNAWYITAFQQYQLNKSFHESIAFSPPAKLDFHSQVFVTLVAPQINKQGEFEGLWGVDIDAQVISKLLPKNDQTLMILLVNSNGVIIVSSFDQPIGNTLIYFQNQSYTGFNQEDWSIVQGRQLRSTNCQDELHVRGYICRYNTKFQKDVHIASTFNKIYKIHIVMLFDLNQSNREYLQCITNIQDMMQNDIEQFVLLTITVFALFYLFFNLCILNSVLKQIVRATQTINSSLYHQFHQEGSRMLQTMLGQSIFNSNLGDQLLKMLGVHLQKMLTSQLMKSIECRIIDKFQYPKHKKKKIRIPINLLSNLNRNETIINNTFPSKPVYPKTEFLNQSTKENKLNQSVMFLFED